MFDWRYSEKGIHSGLFRKILSKKKRKEGTVFRIGIDNAKKLEVGDKESWTAIFFAVARNLDENSS